MTLEGQEKIAAAVDEFVAEAKAEAGDRLKNAGYAISGAAGAKMRARDPQQAAHVSVGEKNR